MLCGQRYNFLDYLDLLKEPTTQMALSFYTLQYTFVTHSLVDSFFSSIDLQIKLRRDEIAAFIDFRYLQKYYLTLALYSLNKINWEVVLLAMLFYYRLNSV